MLEVALLDVRVLPWRPRARVIKAESLRDNTELPVTGDDDVFVIGLALWLLIIVAAPLVVLVLAIGLLSVELPLVTALGLLLLLIRFAGILPWTVVIVDQVSGDERRETYRNLWRAVRRIRSVNGDRRVKTRWAWS